MMQIDFLDHALASYHRKAEKINEEFEETLRSTSQEFLCKINLKLTNLTSEEIDLVKKSKTQAMMYITEEMLVVDSRSLQKIKDIDQMFLNEVERLVTQVDVNTIIFMSKRFLVMKKTEIEECMANKMEVINKNIEELI